MTVSTTIPEATEVAIVGAGPAGCVIASVLAEAGKDVVVLEAGPAWRLEDLVSSQIWSRRLKWGGTPTLAAGRDPVGSGFTGGWGFGGAALHHYGGWPRALPEDLRLQSLFGQGVDWPLDYADLRPWYDRVQREVGLCGDVQTEPGRPDRTPYPMPPLPLFAQARQIARGFERLGRPTRPTPAAINTTTYAGRPACVWDGWCDAGCPTGALANPLVTYLPRARAAGARFVSRATAASVRTDRRGHATALACVDARGQRAELRAAVLILAGGAIQNPRLLLNSASAAHPRGLGNGNGLVGRYFLCHVVASIYGLFDEDVQNYLGVAVPALSGESRSPRNRAGGPFGHYGFGIGPALKPNDLLGIAMSRADLFGRPLHEFLARAARHLGSMSAIAETMPAEHNRVELADGHDAFGLPRARVVNEFSANTRALQQLALADGEELMRAAGAQEVWHGPAVAVHQLGGTRMGRDPGTSVTDSFGQLHEVPNVFIAGGGLFPTCGTTAPTFTIHALALRTAAHLLSKWSSLAA